MELCNRCPDCDGEGERWYNLSNVRCKSKMECGTCDGTGTIDPSTTTIKREYVDVERYIQTESD